MLQTKGKTKETKKPKKRVSTPRPYNGGTKSEAEMRTLITAKLRMLTRWWKPKNKCIQSSGGKCNHCGGKFLKKELQADHLLPIVPVEGWKDVEHLVYGYNWNEWIERAFKETGWQALCKSCHSIKSKKENETRRLNNKKNNVK